MSDNAIEQKQKRSRRTFLSSRHAHGADLQSLDVHVPTIVGKVFGPCHSWHVRPRHVRVTVSRLRGVHYLLRGASECYDSAALRSRLCCDRRRMINPMSTAYRAVG